MFIILFFAALILFQIFLIITTNINIYPEFFFYPWMMSKGFLIYRDFGVQHGFLSYLLLLPFSLDKSFLTLKIFYLAVQSLNLLLVLLIMKKTSSKLGIILGGILYLTLNFYLSENNLWDEIYASAFFLLTYYLAISEKIRTKTKLLASGFLIGLTTLMKPNFGIMIIPVILYFRSLISFIPIVFLWLLTLLYFLLNQALPHFLDNYIFFNRYFVTLPKTFWLERNFFRFTLFTFIVSLLISWLKSKYTSTKKSEDMLFEHSKIKNLAESTLLKSTLFCLSSLILFYPGFNKNYLQPFGAFLIILISQIIKEVKIPLLSISKSPKIWEGKFFNAKKTVTNFFLIYLILIIIFSIFVIRKAKHQYVYLNTYRTPYMENKSIQKTVNELKKINLSDKRLYILGNQIEFYYLLDKPSQVRFYMVSAVGKKYYPKVEDLIIQDLEKNNVDTVIEPKPPDKNYLPLTKLKKYITSKFRLIKDTDTFRIYLFQFKKH